MMATNKQTAITIILLGLFLIMFLGGLILFVSSVISRQKVNKIELPTLDELNGVGDDSSLTEFPAKTSRESSNFYFEDEYDNIVVIPTEGVVDESSMGATRSDYKKSKKKNFSIKTRKNS